MEMQRRVNSVSDDLASAATPGGIILTEATVAFTGTANLFLACAVAGFLLLAVSWFFTDSKHVEKMEDAVNNQKGYERAG